MEKEGDEERLARFKVLSEALLNHRVEVRLKVPLKELFPEPEKKHLRIFWNHNSHGDAVFYRHSQPVLLVELCGFAHFKDKKQRTRDKKKRQICKLNEMNFLSFGNSVLRDLEKPETRNIIKKKLKQAIHGNMWKNNVSQGKLSRPQRPESEVK